LKIALTAILLSFSLCVAAQTVTDESAQKPVPKKVEPKKAEAKKTEPKKVEPTKKAAPKKPDAPKKPAAPAKPSGPTTVYMNDPRAPILRDKDGNPIPTNPNAYDVSSAAGKKK
jgi:hypothetical protein